MASIKWEAGSDSNVMTTALDGLVNDSDAISGAIDNSSNLYIFDEVELYVNAFSTTPLNGGTVQLYIVRGLLSGSGFEDGGSGTIPPSTNLVGVFNLRALDASAQTHIIRQIPIPPGQFKYLLVNKSGADFDFSGNTLRRRPYRYQAV